MLKKLPLFILFFLFFLKNEIFATDLKINEIFVHPSDGNEWVEFYNPESIDLTTYFLDDDIDFNNNDSGRSSKKSLININNSNLLFPFFECSSFLNNSGDYVVLFSPDGQIVDQYEYTKDPGENITIGRSPDGSGEMVILISSTKGEENSSLPTLTPTNTQAPTPSNTATPTLKPTLTSTKTPTPASTKTPTPTSVNTTTSSSLALASSTTTKKLASSNSSVLGQKTLRLSTPSSTITPTKKEDRKEQKVNNLFAFILIFAGVIFITTCAILGFLFYKKKKIKKYGE